MATDRPILLVEDNPDDEALTLRAFNKNRIGNQVVVARDGVEALDYLLARGKFAGRDVHDTPAVVLLDLNLPRLNGLDVLKTVRETHPISHVPVVVLTSSDEDSDRLAAYRHFANSYVRKPVNYDDFLGAARELGLYWLVLNRPAPRGPL